MTCLSSRMRVRSLLVICLAGLVPHEVFAQLRAVPYANGVAFTSPIAFIQDPSDAANQFVVQQGGVIRLVRNGVVQPADFLNIASQISSGGERGLLGMAVAPDYATSGRFYLYFNAPDGDIVIARYKRDGDDPLIADPASRFDLRWFSGSRSIEHSQFGNHNGGNLAFGPDGNLYIGTGDGGSGNDPLNNGQNMQSLLGKILRIDVSVADGHQDGFVIPPGNPFASGQCSGSSPCPEIWDTGLRNPWRWSFDNPARGGTGALIIADVGQNAREEINYEPAGQGGKNYGWRIREGTIATAGVGATTPAFLPLTDPIFDYDRTSGFSVTGGFVYRGAALSAYAGRYFFGDFGTGRIWSLALAIDPATGQATASDLRNHTGELASAAVSTFGVDANGELYFANYVTGVIYRIEAAGPTMAVDKTSLAFGAVLGNQAFTSKTSTQTLRLTQAGQPGTVTWTVSSGAPWLVVSPTSGTGSATLSVSVQFPPGGSIGEDQTANLTFSFTGAAVVPSTVPVRLRVYSGTSSPPVGVVDTPADNATNLAGSIAVTGWALDDVEVTRVRIWRDAVAGETLGPLVLIGDATLVEGARPDVAAGAPGVPHATRAGWGYLLLTNFMPNLGNGTFRLHAIAEDSNGHSVLLGSKTITVNNAASSAPFGAIDTPEQGGVASGVVINFGWVLSRAPRRADPPGGGNVQVVIDGAIAPITPTGWTSRADITALFPAAEYPGVVNAVGNATVDSRTLANGVHTIAWVVTDNEGNASGIGSRYFTVSNGSGSVTADASAPVAAQRSPPSSPAREIVGRRGFDPYGAFEAFQADRDGIVTIAIPELGRVELWFEAGVSGHGVTPNGPGPLPIGARLDRETGRFTWNPGAGFVGVYDFVFDGRTVRLVVGGH